MAATMLLYRSQTSLGKGEAHRLQLWLASIKAHNWKIAPEINNAAQMQFFQNWFLGH